MSNPTENVEILWATRDRIYEDATPPACLEPPCTLARTKAKSRARAVMAGETTLETAAADHADDISRNCQLGSTATGSCVGNRVICGYYSTGISTQAMPEMPVRLAEAEQ